MTSLEHEEGSRGNDSVSDYDYNHWDDNENWGDMEVWRIVLVSLFTVYFDRINIFSNLFLDRWTVGE